MKAIEGYEEIKPYTNDTPGGAKHYDSNTILDALDHIDPVVLSYDEWNTIGMALKYEGLPCAAWDRWSQKDPKRYEAGMCTKKWRSFKNDRNKPVTAGTIIYMAKERGWTPPENAVLTDTPKNESAALTDAPEQAPAAEKMGQIRPNTPYKYDADIKNWMSQVGEIMDYLTDKGFTAETVNKFMVGYDPHHYFNAVNEYRPAVIFPYSRDCSYYIARDLSPHIDHVFDKPSLSEAGNEPVFNAGALTRGKDKPCFLCEGATDVMSIVQAGYNACAIIGNGKAHLIDRIKSIYNNPDNADRLSPLILCFDYDENGTGQKTTNDVRSLLQTAHIPYYEADFDAMLYEGAGEMIERNDGSLDPNDLLQLDPEQFKSDLSDIINDVLNEERQKARPDNISHYIDSLMTDEIKAFKADIKTGYQNLDQLSGGLYSGLYVVAAISSLGKTTFVHQMGDQIAAAGTDVLYFSLEQSRLEMVSKSIARITAQHDLKTAVTSLSIRKGYLPQNVLQAAKEYQETAGDRVSIIEGNFSCSLSFIGDYIRRYISNNNVKPVVIVDYLQILQPEEIGGRPQSTKETVDSTVTALKRMSREYGITIIAICSVNRANYLTPIDFESLKESGNIEFTADVIWGLQLHCLEADPIFSDANKIKEKREKIKDEKARNPRNIDLVCLKNRYGIANYNCSFEYYPANDLFKPVTDFENAEATAKYRL